MDRIRKHKPEKREGWGPGNNNKKTKEGATGKMVKANIFGSPFEIPTANWGRKGGGNWGFISDSQPQDGMGVGREGRPVSALVSDGMFVGSEIIISKEKKKKRGASKVSGTQIGTRESAASEV